MKPIIFGMALPLICWQLAGAPAGPGFWAFLIVEFLAVIAGGWALWQILRVIGESGDTYYRLHTRKLLSKEYHDS